MIVVDASVVVKLVLNETDSDLVRARWRRWTDESEVIAVPPFFASETLSALRRAVYRGVTSKESADEAYERLERLDTDTREPGTLYRVAWNLAKRFNRPTVYDCCYLALASIFGCEFWTADLRLVNAVGHELLWVRAATH